MLAENYRYLAGCDVDDRDRESRALGTRPFAASLLARWQSSGSTSRTHFLVRAWAPARASAFGRCRKPDHLAIRDRRHAVSLTDPIGLSTVLLQLVGCAVV